MSKELGRLFSHEMGRRDVLRYTGMGVGVSAALAACKKASDTASQQPGASHAPLEQEPGGLQVFDWAGYGDGTYYPGKERLFLWQQYADETGDTPKFILFENDDAGYTKVASGTRYAIIHPRAYRFRDDVDNGFVQPWNTSQIPNFPDLNPELQKFGQLDGKQYFIVEDWGFIAPLYRGDKVERPRPPGRCCSTIATAATSRGSTPTRCS